MAIDDYEGYDEDDSSRFDRDDDGFGDGGETPDLHSPFGELAGLEWDNDSAVEEELTARDAADEYIRAHEAGLTGNINPKRSKEDYEDWELEGAMTPATFMEHKLNTLGTSMKHAAHEILAGRVIATSDKQAHRLDAIAKNFSHLNEGVSNSEMADRMDFGGEQIPSDITGINPVGYQVAGVYHDDVTGQARKDRGAINVTLPNQHGRQHVGHQAGRGEENVYGHRTNMPSESETYRAMVYLEQTAGLAEQTGPGGALHGHTLNAERASKREEDQNLAYTLVGNIVDKHYLTAATKASDVYQLRRESAVSEIITYLIDADLAQQQSHIVPLPNEMFTEGMNITMGIYGSQQGAGWSTIEADQELAARGLTRKELNADIPYHKLLLQQIGSVRGTMAPFDKKKYGSDGGWSDESTAEGRARYLEGKAKQSEDWDTFYSDIKFVRETLRADGLTNRDESAGNDKRIAGKDMPDFDQAATAAFRNEVSGEAGMQSLSGWSGDAGHDPNPNPGQKSLTITSGVGWRNRDFGGSLKDLLGSVRHAKAAADGGANIQPAVDGTGLGGSEGRAGMHGAKAISEQEEEVMRYKSSYDELMKTEGMNYMDAINIVIANDGDQPPETGVFVGPARTEQEQYQQMVAINKPPKQGSKEWLAQREGLITASKGAPDLISGGSGKVAVDLAEQRLVEALPEGDFKEYRKLQLQVNNAYTTMGTDFESRVQDSFMKNKGQGLSAEVAFFERGEGADNIFGASPDARLYNEDGSSAGLLELKYLSQSRMKGSAERYEAQMQMQMMVTGESVTNFFAMSRETGEYVHKVVHADADYQNTLRLRGLSAMGLEKGINSQEELEMAKGQKFNAGNAPQGQKVSVDINKEAEEEMSVFSLARLTTPNLTYGRSRTREDVYGESYAGRFGSDEDQDNKARMVKEGVGSVEELNAIDAKESAHGEAIAANKSVDRNAKKVSDQAAKDAAADIKAMSAIHSEALRENAAANKAAAASARDLDKSFSSLMKAAGGVAKGLLSVANRANDSGMDVVRAAATSGMSEEAVRGMSDTLVEEGGLTEGQALSTIAAAGRQSDQFKNMAGLEAAYTPMVERYVASGLPGKLPTPMEMSKMSAEDRIPWAQDQINKGKTPEERRMIANTIGFEHLATAAGGGVDGEALQADGVFDGQAARDVNRGKTNIEHKGRTAAEVLLQSGGEAGGNVLGAANLAAGNAGLIKSSVALIKSAAALDAAAMVMAGGRKVGIRALAAAGGAVASGAGLAASSAALAGGAAGYGIYKLAEDTDTMADIGDGVGAAIDGTLAFFGNDDAQERRDNHNRLATLTDIDGPKAVAGQASKDNKKSPVNVTSTIVIAEDLITKTTDIDGDTIVDVHALGQ